jgi:hypothetical protein
MSAGAVELPDELWLAVFVQCLSGSDPIQAKWAFQSPLLLGDSEETENGAPRELFGSAERRRLRWLLRVAPRVCVQFRRVLSDSSLFSEMLGKDFSALQLAPLPGQEQRRIAETLPLGVAPAPREVSWSLARAAAVVTASVSAVSGYQEQPLAVEQELTPVTRPFPRRPPSPSELQEQEKRERGSAENDSDAGTAALQRLQGSFPLEYLPDACLGRPSCSCCEFATGRGVVGGTDDDDDDGTTCDSTLVRTRLDSAIRDSSIDEDATFPDLLPAAPMLHSLGNAVGDISEIGPQTDSDPWRGFLDERLCWRLPRTAELGGESCKGSKGDDNSALTGSDGDSAEAARAARHDLSFFAWGRSNSRDSRLFAAPRPKVPLLCYAGGDIRPPPATELWTPCFHDLSPREQVMELWEHGVPLLEGLWIGEFGSHGDELVEIVQRGFWIRGRKLCGDPNVCSGQTSFFAALSRQAGGSGDGARWGQGYIQLAMTGFLRPFFDQAFVHVAPGGEYIEVTWVIGQSPSPTRYTRASERQARFLLNEHEHRSARDRAEQADAEA